jgi:hypothetical protein
MAGARLPGLAYTSHIHINLHTHRRALRPNATREGKLMFLLARAGALISSVALVAGHSGDPWLGYTFIKIQLFHSYTRQLDNVCFLSISVVTVNVLAYKNDAFYLAGSLFFLIPLFFVLGKYIAYKAPPNSPRIFSRFVFPIYHIELPADAGHQVTTHLKSHLLAALFFPHMSYTYSLC